MDVLHFLEGAIPDGRGRTLSMIMALDDQAIESTHDFIQWVFPLDEPSALTPVHRFWIYLKSRRSKAVKLRRQILCNRQIGISASCNGMITGLGNMIIIICGSPASSNHYAC